MRFKEHNIYKKYGRKKADAGILAAIVLGMMVIIVALFLLMKIYYSAEESMKTNNCRNSIASHSMLIQGTKGQMITDIKCPTRYLKVDNTDDEKAKKYIAEDMHRCWHEWLRGNATLFNGEGVFCYVCSVYDFKQKGQKMEGFSQFLRQKHIDVKYFDDTPGLKYSEYFSAVLTPGALETLTERDIEDITMQFPDKTRKITQTEANQYDFMNTSEKYATIFVYASGKTFITKVLEDGGRSDLGVFGGVIAFTGVGIAIVSNPVGWVVGGVGLAVVGVGAVVFAIFGETEMPEYAAFIEFRHYSAESISALGCQEGPVGQSSHSEP